MIEPSASVIDAPYPADLEAKGWSLDIDYEKVEQSDTWAVATAEQRPWLLMLWMVSWRQAPVASLPNSDRLIAARIGLPVDQFMAWKDVLMSGWQLATDGRLYHRTLTQNVLRMANKRDKDRARVAAFRAKSQIVAAGNDPVAPCNALPTRDYTVSSTPTPTPTPLPTPTTQLETSVIGDTSKSASRPNPDRLTDLPIHVQAAQAMIKAGCHANRVNPQHPALLDACRAGCTPEMLAATVVEGLARAPPIGEPFTWAIKTAHGRVADASNKPVATAKHSAAADFRGKEYAGTDEASLPAELR